MRVVDPRRPTRAAAALLVLAAAALTACAGGPRTLELMPAPSVFADWDEAPLPRGEPPVSYDDVGDARVEYPRLDAAATGFDFG